MGCPAIKYYTEKLRISFVKIGAFGKEKSPATSYRYGFNGQEKDNEVKGTGNSYDFGVRNIYDARLGRFISVDPNYRYLPDYSPYQYARNVPIMLKENGNDGVIPTWLWQSGIVSPYSAGFIDAVAADVEGLWDITKTIMAFSPGTPYFWTQSAAKIRQETVTTVNTVVTIMTDPVLRAIVLANISADLMKQIEEANSKDWEYAAGYTTWTVLSFFVGVGEVATFAKTGKAGAGIAKFFGILSRTENKVDHLANIVRRAANHVNKTEWHHIIPAQLKNNSIVQRAIKAGYNFEQKLDNLIPLEKFLRDAGGVHANHPNYTRQIREAFNKFEIQYPNFTDNQAKAFLEDVSKQIVKVIDENSATKVNDLKLNLTIGT